MSRQRYMIVTIGTYLPLIRSTAKAAEVEKNRKEALENLAKYARIRQANAIRALSTNCGDENFLRIYPFPM